MRDQQSHTICFSTISGFIQSSFPFLSTKIQLYYSKPSSCRKSVLPSLEYWDLQLGEKVVTQHNLFFLEWRLHVAQSFYSYHTKNIINHNITIISRNNLTIGCWIFTSIFRWTSSAFRQSMLPIVTASCLSILSNNKKLNDHYVDKSANHSLSIAIDIEVRQQCFHTVNATIVHRDKRSCLSILQSDKAQISAQECSNEHYYFILNIRINVWMR